MTKSIRTSLCAILSFGPTVPTLAQTIENAGFELPNLGLGQWKENLAGMGWTFNEAAGIASGSNAWGRGGHSGSQYAFIQSSGDGIGIMSQRVMGLTVGYRYRLSFWMARRDTEIQGIMGANVAAPIEVRADNEVILEFTTPSPDGKWLLCQTKPFVATTKGVTLIWMAKKCFHDQASLIDDVNLTAMRRYLRR